MTLTEDQLASRERAIRDRVRALSEDGRQTFYHRLRKDARDPDTYAVLNYLMLAGLHHYYLGRWWRGTANLVVFLVGAALALTVAPVVGAALVVLVFVVELPQLFRAQTIVAEHNLALQERLIDRLESGRAPVRPSFSGRRG